MIKLIHNKIIKEILKFKKNIPVLVSINHINHLKY